MLRSLGGTGLGSPVTVAFALFLHLLHMSKGISAAEEMVGQGNGLWSGGAAPVVSLTVHSKEVWDGYSKDLEAELHLLRQPHESILMSHVMLCLFQNFAPPLAKVEL